MLRHKIPDGQWESINDLFQAITAEYALSRRASFLFPASKDVNGSRRICG